MASYSGLMIRWLIFVLALAAFAGDKPKRPEYLKRKPDEKQTKTIPPPKVDASEPALPAVSEMKVETSNSGNAVSEGKPIAKPDSAIHGDLRTGGAADAKAASGTVVVKDKKSGKWAITAGGEKAKTQ